MVEVPIWLNGGGELPNTVQMAHLQAERLLLVRRWHGAVYKAISALLRKNGANTTWSEANVFAVGEALAEINLFNDPIDSRHIFPVAYCKKQGIDKDRYNSLVNLTPFDYQTRKLVERLQASTCSITDQGQRQTTKLVFA